MATITLTQEELKQQLDDAYSKGSSENVVKIFDLETQLAEKDNIIASLHRVINIMFDEIPK